MPLSEVAEIRPNKREILRLLTNDAIVSFVPMECLNASNRNLTTRETRPLSNVYKSYTYFRDGDVLLAKITPCFENGKLGVARGLVNGVGFGSSEFFVIRPNSNALADYIYHFLNQQSVRDAGKRFMSGAVGHKRVPKDFIEVLAIPIPPLEEQRRILAVLDEAFEGLDRARAHAEANLLDTEEFFDNNLAAIFQDITSDVRLLKLSEVAVDFGRGRSRHRPRNDPDLYGGNYPFIQTGDVRNCSGIVSNYFQTYNDQGLAQSKLWPQGTVCITIAANIAETGILGFGSCFPDSVIGVVCDQHITLPEYVEFMLRYFATDLKAQGSSALLI